MPLIGASYRGSRPSGSRNRGRCSSVSQTIVASPSFGLIPNKAQSHRGSPLLAGPVDGDPRFATYIQRSRFYRRENRYAGKIMRAKGLARVQSLRYLRVKNKGLIKINGERGVSTFSAMTPPPLINLRCVKYNKRKLN